MSSSENIQDPMWVPKTPPNVPRSSMINLVNLLLRETSHRITVLERTDGPDPQIYVVTRVNWRDADVTKPVLPQLPRILSLLETLRGSKGVPREVYLDSTEGIAVYLPSGMKVSELPDLWNAKMEELLNIIPPDDAQGVLQDVHWSGGAFGYFPTYTLGNLYASQFYVNALKKNPDLPDDFKNGNYDTLLNYLRENIHQYGRIYRPLDLVKRVTGEDLNPNYFIKYLETKFYPIYGI